jgi:bifunctional lysine-specific demethylase and histidyl-hydroxylase NO66
MNRTELLQEYIFGKCGLEEFKSQHLDKEPLHLPAANRLHEQITVGTVDEYLAANEGNIHVFTRVLDGNTDVTIHANPVFFAETQKSFVDRQLQAGATIKIEDFETRHPLMASICRSFEAEFGGDTYAMTFLTPPERQGFGVHFDPVSSFIIQLSGEKHWKVYPEWVQFPTKTMNRPLAGLPMPPAMMEITLKAGDLLYIPPGFPHEAACTKEHSLHMTIGLGALRPIELLSHAQSILCERHVELRRPIYPTSEDFEERLKEAAGILSAAIERIDPAQLRRVFDVSYAANRPNSLIRGMENYLKACAADDHSKVGPIENKRSRFLVEDGKVKILPPSTIRPGRPLLVDPPFIELPAIAAKEVEHLLRLNSPIKVSDLEGDLDEESKLILAKRLAMFGLVEVMGRGA